MITIDLRSRVPIYEQIKNGLLELMLVGALQPHEQLPSIRELARQLNLNVNTVKKAFSDLEEAGAIYTLTGRGSFVGEQAALSPQLRARALEELRTALSGGRAKGLTKEEALRLLEETYKD